MTMLGDKFVPLKCPTCKIIPLKLIPLNDDGTGKKVCRHCKKKKENNHGTNT